MHVGFTFSAVKHVLGVCFLGGGGRRRKTNEKHSIAKRSRTTNKVQGRHYPTTDVLGVFAAFEVNNVSSHCRDINEVKIAFKKKVRMSVE